MQLDPQVVPGGQPRGHQHADLTLPDLFARADPLRVGQDPPKVL